MTTQIATWFVADLAAEASYFPQVGARSDAPETQAIYWRCAAVFFASSLVANPDARHVFYTNSVLPRIDGVDLASLFAQWGVETVHLPISYRLDPAHTDQWGNQFYVFDVLRDFVERQGDDRLILLDSDCLWLRAVDPLAEAIDRHGALTLPLGPDEHPEGEPINGVTREQLARFARRFGEVAGRHLEYCGGEILALNREAGASVLRQFDSLWPQVLANAPDAPREEAHLLSVIYALEGFAMGTADPFVRRLWTTFRHNNLHDADRDLAIWHLPAEKRTGFAELFGRIAANPGAEPSQLGLDFGTYASSMGWPRRRPAKFVRDAARKLAEKVR